MAERDQLVRALGRHDAGKARGAEHVALLGVALRGSAPRVSGSITTQPSAIGGAAGDVLLGDVDHVGRAGRVEMGERPLSCGLAEQQLARRGRHIRLPHQALADEEGADADLRQALDVRDA